MRLRAMHDAVSDDSYSDADVEEGGDDAELSATDDVPTRGAASMQPY